MLSAIRNILHPTDFSENSKRAFEIACSLARDYHARLILLHVMYPAGFSEWTSEPTGNVEEHLAWPQPPFPEVNIDHRAVDGDPAEETLRVAKDAGCDLIVIGTHGRTGLDRLLTGSVAEEVLRKASCPVLAVKNPPATRASSPLAASAKAGA